MQMVRETSIEAYNKIRDGKLLSHRRWQIYDWLYKNGPATANQIFAGIFGSMHIAQANIHARLHEMREMGCIIEVGTGLDPITNNRVIQFDVSDKLPKKVKFEKLLRTPYFQGFENALESVLKETNARLQCGKLSYSTKMDIIQIIVSVKDEYAD